MGPEHENAGGHFRVGSDEMLFENQIGEDEFQVEVKKLLQEGVVDIKRR